MFLDLSKSKHFFNAISNYQLCTGLIEKDSSNPISKRPGATNETVSAPRRPGGITVTDDEAVLHDRNSSGSSGGGCCGG